MQMTEENKKFIRTIFGNFSQKWKEKFIENTIKEKYSEARIVTTLRYMELCKKYFLDLDIIIGDKVIHLDLEDVPYSNTVNDVYTLMCGVAMGIAFS